MHRCTRLLPILVTVAACSAGNEDPPRALLDAALPAPDARPTAEMDAGADPAKTVDAACGACDANADAGEGGRVVLNEVCPSPDYVELLNIGTASVDISGWILADSESGPGSAAKLTEALTFPAGTVVAAGARLYVQADLPDGGSTCLDGGASRCFAASFGISGSKGEEMYLLRPDKSVADRTGFGADAIAAGKSWSRLPDGTGAFAVGVQTPNAPNR